jgi:hypothetical protein
MTKIVNKNARSESEDSGADSNEPMHDLDKTIPCKKIKTAKTVQFKDIKVFFDLKIIESSNEDDIQLKAEDKAFLKSIDKEKTEPTRHRPNNVFESYLTLAAVPQ